LDANEELIAFLMALDANDSNISTYFDNLRKLDRNIYDLISVARVDHPVDRNYWLAPHLRPKNLPIMHLVEPSSASGGSGGGTSTVRVFPSSGHIADTRSVRMGTPVLPGGTSAAAATESIPMIGGVGGLAIAIAPELILGRSSSGSAPMSGGTSSSSESETFSGGTNVVGSNAANGSIGVSNHTN